MSKVPVQKGKVNANPPTMKTMTQSQKVAERRHEMSEMKRCQTMDYKTPKK